MKELKINIKNHILKPFFLLLGIIVFCLTTLGFMSSFGLIKKEYYNAKKFNIKTIYSSVDYDNDKIDDYSDFLLGARKDALNKPKYVSKYYDNSYPPNNEGVCTDVIWRAFKHAGYSLRDMVDNDIKLHPEDYPEVINRDKNIDFRRVNNLNIFFSKYAITLTNDYKEIETWQPGDIVIFENKHIGIVSDRRNIKGITYIIHNNGQLEREQDYLGTEEVTAHYRFDASLVDKDILFPFKNQ